MLKGCALIWIKAGNIEGRMLISESTYSEGVTWIRK